MPSTIPVDEMASTRTSTSATRNGGSETRNQWASRVADACPTQWFPNHGLAFETVPSTPLDGETSTPARLGRYAVVDPTTNAFWVSA